MFTKFPDISTQRWLIALREQYARTGMFQADHVLLVLKANFEHLYEIYEINLVLGNFY